MYNSIYIQIHNDKYTMSYKNKEEVSRASKTGERSLIGNVPGTPDIK